MITKEQLIKLKEHLIDSSATISIYLLTESRTDERTLKVERVLFDKHVRAALLDIAIQYFSKLSDVEITNNTIIPLFDPDDEQDLFYLNAGEINIWDSVEENVTTDNEDYFNIKQKANVKIKAWVFKVEYLVDGQTDTIILFQEFQNAKLLALKLLVLIFEDNVLQLIDKSTISINESMDFVFYHGGFFMLKAKAFERVFSYQVIYKDNAKKLIDDIQALAYSDGRANMVIQDPDALKLKIDTSIRFAQKLYSAKAKGYYKNISYQKLVALNRQHKLELSLDADTKTWTIDNQIPIDVVVRILNDDYEKSLLTNNQYISKKKQQIV